MVSTFVVVPLVVWVVWPHCGHGVVISKSGGYSNHSACCAHCLRACVAAFRASLWWGLVGGLCAHVRRSGKVWGVGVLVALHRRFKALCIASRTSWASVHIGREDLNACEGGVSVLVVVRSVCSCWMSGGVVWVWPFMLVMVWGCVSWSRASW